jgi:prevent-host-death family protein
MKFSLEMKMKFVGAFEAKNKLGQLLDLAEQGEEVTITRHGKPVARIVPAATEDRRGEARAANRRMRERAEAAKLGRFDWAEWKAFRDEGRP